jgi:hypothetical protein
VLFFVSLFCDRLKKKRLALEKKTCRMVQAGLWNLGAKLGKKCHLVVSGKPEVMQWIVPGKGKCNGKRRYIGRSAARVTQRMRLVSLHNYLLRALCLKYGTPALSPHEGYTTNTCMECHTYVKGATFTNRYRLCPNEECPTRASEPPTRYHRELISVVNQVLAARCQLCHLQVIQP